MVEFTVYCIDIIKNNEFSVYYSVPSSSSPIIIFFFHVLNLIEYVDLHMLFTTLKWPFRFRYLKFEVGEYFAVIQVLQ